MDTILDLLKQDGIEPQYSCGLHGGEYESPCPMCGGENRFHAWPEEGDGGRWWCRRCLKSGDCIQYLRDVRGMSYFAACKFLGKEPDQMYKKAEKKQTRSYDWKPREIVSPAERWIEKATAFAKWAKENLWKKADILQWLETERGLSDEWIKRAFLGWNPQTIFQSRKDWGLQPDGKKTKLILPEGTVIPFSLNGTIQRIRIRRQNPGPDESPYHIVAGSCTVPMVFGKDKKVFIIVESELDAILLEQQVEDLAGVIALGSAQAKPDERTMKILEASELILISLDNDDAGLKAAWLWWTEYFDQARRWPPVDGKDPGEMWKAGIDLHEWAEAGIEEFSRTPKTRPVFVDASLDIAEVQEMAFEDFIRAHLVVRLHSDSLGEDFYVVSTPEIKAMVERETPGAVVYLPDEILNLRGLTPAEAVKAHMLKRAFGGMFLEKKHDALERKGD